MTPNTPAGGAVAQGTPEWYVDELRVLASHITGRGVGICNGAAMTIERLRKNRPATVPLDAVLLIVDKLRNSHINRQAIADELEALTRGEG